MFTARLYRLVEFITFFSCAAGSNCILYDGKCRRFYMAKRTKLYNRIFSTIIAIYDVFAIFQTVRMKLTGSDLFNMCSAILLPTQLALVVLSIIVISSEEVTSLINQLVIHFIINFESTKKLSIHIFHANVNNSSFSIF